eukprot:CAMPEP_0179048244 /NCGR_PEP_ID=MMETSP0796-20121207/19611_1 /TAXON_ID=73915 /ORGANISM="Pyrodinium bahamense, Strain pbaha01" /LENGTH=119 /DNA_ID=CAMNT_0020744711 /DNA_START=606 /DNA_END=965 /DNA_ORIENTATION=-
MVVSLSTTGQLSIFPDPDPHIAPSMLISSASAQSAINSLTRVLQLPGSQTSCIMATMSSPPSAVVGHVISKLISFSMHPPQIRLSIPSPSMPSTPAHEVCTSSRRVLQGPSSQTSFSML